MTDASTIEWGQENAALYALGALSPHEAQAFERWLAEAGPTPHATLAGFEKVVAALAYAVPAVTPRAALRTQLLVRLALPPSTPVPQAPAGFAVTRFAEIQWKQTEPGVWAKVLYKDPVARTITVLYKLEPGKSFSTHRHPGSEQCFILAGDFIVNGQTFGPGDFHCALPGSTHDFITTTQGTTLLVISPYHYELQA